VGIAPLLITGGDGQIRSVGLGKVYYVPGFVVNIISSREVETSDKLYYSAFLKGLHTALLSTPPLVSMTTKKDRIKRFADVFCNMVHDAGPISDRNCLDAFWPDFSDMSSHFSSPRTYSPQTTTLTDLRGSWEYLS
jgi:hypothetical protein